MLVASSCSHDSTRSEPPPPPLSRATVSSPLTTQSGSTSRRAPENSDAVLPFESTVYVSMQPGVSPAGVSVSIRRQGDQAVATTVPMVDGGFDPVAIFAEDGDTLEIVTHDANGSPHSGFGLVTRRRPPSVVRTMPAAQRTDVPLNTGVMIVFTEPMDSASIVNGITLQLDGAVIPTTITFASNGGGAIQVTVQPVSALKAGKTYDLVISSSVLNLLGDAIAAPVVIPFTTEFGQTNPFGDLTIESFAMIEYQYDGTGQYYYAPQIVVTAPPGQALVHITGFVLASMTNFPINLNSDECTTTVDVAPGQTRQLFHEFYGDYPLAYWWPGRRPTPGPAFARLTYQREGGARHTVAIQGSMSPGGLPGTYSGGQGLWYFCADGPG